MRNPYRPGYSQTLVTGMLGGYHIGKRIAKAKAKAKKPRKRGFKQQYQPEAKKLTSQVKYLQKLAESDMGTVVRRIRDTGRVLSSANSSSIGGAAPYTVTTLETAMNNLKVFDPAAPATLISVDFSQGTFQKEILFSKITSKMLVRNNYQVPAKVRLYLCTPKNDTSISPPTAFSQGLSDESAATTSDANIYPTDVEQFNDLWSIKESVAKELQPGQELSLSHSIKSFQYDTSFNDSHSLSYQKKYQSHYYMIRVEGILGHDTTADEQGILSAGVDYLLDRTFTLKYDAGADLKYIQLTDNSDAFSNSGVVSMKPVSDNIAYSVA